jgi:putative DNA primase/helicase
MTASPAKDPFTGLEDDLRERLIEIGSSNPGDRASIPGDLLLQSGVSILSESSNINTITEALRQLAGLAGTADKLVVAAAREGAVKKLKEIGVQAPGKLVDAAFSDKPQAEAPEAERMTFTECEPWPEPVPGDDLLAGIRSMFTQHLVVSSHEAVAISLWTVLTYFTDNVDILPLLLFTSPEKRCGKTLALEISQNLVRRPLMASNISAAATFRVIDKYHPTLLIDEADTFLGQKDELRGVINSGHRRSSAFVIRCEGDDSEPREFSTWCPKAIALIGRMADTLEDRAIAIKLRRKSPQERVARFQLHKMGKDLDILRRCIVRFANDNAEAVKHSDPIVPNQLNDRAQDNWRPLLAIADIAGGEWPELARAAALQISGADQFDESVKVMLLQDIHAIFQNQQAGHVASAILCQALGEERPWPEWKNGKRITPRQLAQLLKPFDIQPKQTRVDSSNIRAYHLEDFRDALSRYAYLSATVLQVNNDAGLRDFRSATGNEV